MQVKFKVNISCKHCVASINEQLATLKGIEQVGIDLATKIVAVEFNDHISIQQIQNQIADLGFDVELITCH